MSRLLVQLQFGEAKHLEAPAHQLQVTSVIVLEPHFATVIEVAIGFDHESCLSPKEVNEVGADANVDLGWRKPVTAAEQQEVSL
jgi:hypothetical protein